MNAPPPIIVSIFSVMIGLSRFNYYHQQDNPDHNRLTQQTPNQLSVTWTITPSLPSPASIFNIVTSTNVMVRISAGPDPRVPLNLRSGTEYTDLSVLWLHTQGYGFGSVSTDLGVTCWLPVNLEPNCYKSWLNCDNFGWNSKHLFQINFT